MRSLGGFSICCRLLSSGAGRGLSGTVAATVSREQRREGGGEREEKEEDAVAAVRSRGRPTSPPTKGWILLPAESGQRSRRHKLEVIGHSTLDFRESPYYDLNFTIVER